MITHIRFWSRVGNPSRVTLHQIDLRRRLLLWRPGIDRFWWFGEHFSTHLCTPSDGNKNLQISRLTNRKTLFYFCADPFCRNCGYHYITKHYWTGKRPHSFIDINSINELKSEGVRPSISTPALTTYMLAFFVNSGKEKRVASNQTHSHVLTNN